MGLLFHLYRFAETYVVLFAWICVPLGFYTALLFLNRQYGFFQVKEEAPSKGKSDGTH